MTSRDDLVDLITSTAVAALNWNWMATGATPSPEATFRHVAEAIYEAAFVSAGQCRAETELFGHPDTLWRCRHAPGHDGEHETFNGVHFVELEQIRRTS